MSSQFNAENHQRDPDNAFLWRANPRRLDAEAIRDGMLSISGELDLQRPDASVVAEAGYVRVRNGVLGNPRDRIRQQTEAMRRQAMVGGPNRAAFPGQRRRVGEFPAAAGARRDAANQIRQVAAQVVNALDGENAKYRSVYLPIVRDEEPRSLQVFDFADSNSTIGAREESNTANQALYMMNNPFVLQQSQAMAARIAQEQATIGDRVDEAFRLAFARSPTTTEKSAAAQLLRDFHSSSGKLQPLAVLCQGLLASAEFRYID